MSDIYKWYEQWSCDSKKIITNMGNVNKQKNSKLKSEVILNWDSYLNPKYKRYSSNESKSIVDPSYIYDKVIKGVCSIVLRNQEPSEYKNPIYEYGYNSENKCIYRKLINNKNEKFDRLYIYLENIIYELGICNIDIENISELTFTILGEFSINIDKTPKEIKRHYGLLSTEKYKWINKNVAFINADFKTFILIKDSLGVVGVFQKVLIDKTGQLFSYNTQNYVDWSICNQLIERKLFYEDSYLSYYILKDKNGKMTEYGTMKVCGESYFVSSEYIRPPKNFSFKKAKDKYVSEIIEFINSIIINADSKVTHIGIEYFNYGYSILDVLIGMDNRYHDDIHSMKIIKDFRVGNDNTETFTYLDTYINTNMYFQSFKRIMEFIKKEIERQHKVIVILNEISD